jgi:hypothetical protein
MSICAPCTQLKQISLCTDSLIIGVVSEENAAYLVYFKSLATGSLNKYSVTSDSNGVLTLQFTDSFPLASGTGYEMWVNQAGDSIESKSDLTIGTTTATCFTLSAQTVYDVYYDVFANYDSQTLEVL